MQKRQIQKILLAFHSGFEVKQSTRETYARLIRRGMNILYKDNGILNDIIEKKLNININRVKCRWNEIFLGNKIYLDEMDFDHLFVNKIEFADLKNRSGSYLGEITGFSSISITFTPFASKCLSEDTLKYIACHVYGHIAKDYIRNIFYTHKTDENILIDTQADSILYPESDCNRDEILSALLEIKEVFSRRWFGIWSLTHKDEIEHLNRRIREVNYNAIDTIKNEVLRETLGLVKGECSKVMYFTTNDHYKKKHKKKKKKGKNKK